MYHTYHKPLPKVPIIRPEEVPERKMEYNKQSLLQFKEELVAKEEADKLAASRIKAGGLFGGFGEEEKNKEGTRLTVEKEASGKVYCYW